MIHGAVVLVWLVACAVQDVRQRLLANRLTLGVALLALIYLLWTGTTWLGATAGGGALGLLSFIIADVARLRPGPPGRGGCKAAGRLRTGFGFTSLAGGIYWRCGRQCAVGFARAKTMAAYESTT
ncbi:prepilin peptidase [Pseudomonas tolaasii]